MSSLTFQTKACDHKHTVCLNNIQFFKSSMAKLTTANLEKFIDSVLINGNYNNCLSNYSNKNSELVLDFIILSSGLVVINPAKLISLTQCISSDEKLISIIKNQLKLNPNYKKELINCKSAKTYYNNNLYFMLMCISSKKMNTINFMMEDLDINNFFEMIKTVKDIISVDCEKIFCEYINKNKELIKTHKNINDLVDSFINKPKILKIVYNIMASSLTPQKKLDILNKVALSNTLEPSLILIIMEGNDIVPNDTTFTNLLSKIYFRSTGALNSKTIAEIIDIFVLYGFKITKNVVISLLKNGCYVNSIEKHQIQIDNSILEECAELGYYPYDFTCIPSAKVMMRECTKENNLEQIRKLKEKGGVLTSECLEKACCVRKNGKVIKYIISDCKVKPNDACLIMYQTTYGLEALDIIMKNYDNKKEVVKKNNDKLILDNDSTMTVDKRNIEINAELDYTLKSKIKKILDYKKKTIKYVDLYELMLKYLINHNLIIGNYFVINNELCNLLKINQCTLINIDQLDNILSYFIDIVV